MSFFSSHGDDQGGDYAGGDEEMEYSDYDGGYDGEVYNYDRYADNNEMNEGEEPEATRSGFFGSSMNVAQVEESDPSHAFPENQVVAAARGFFPNTLPIGIAVCDTHEQQQTPQPQQQHHDHMTVEDTIPHTGPNSPQFQHVQPSDAMDHREVERPPQSAPSTATAAPKTSVPSPGSTRPPLPVRPATAPSRAPTVATPFRAALQLPASRTAQQQAQAPKPFSANPFANAAKALLSSPPPAPPRLSLPPPASTALAGSGSGDPATTTAPTAATKRPRSPTQSISDRGGDSPGETRLPVETRRVSFAQTPPDTAAGTKRTSSEAITTTTTAAVPSPTPPPRTTWPTPQTSQLSPPAERPRPTTAPAATHFVTPPFSRTPLNTGSTAGRMGGDGGSGGGPGPTPSTPASAATVTPTTASARTSTAAAAPASGAPEEDHEAPQATPQPEQGSHGPSTSPSEHLALVQPDPAGGAQALQTCTSISERAAEVLEKLQRMRVQVQQRKEQVVSRWKELITAESKVLAEDGMAQIAPKLLQLKKRLDAVKGKWAAALDKHGKVTNLPESTEVA